jgi:hypothetical protein
LQLAVGYSTEGSCDSAMLDGIQAYPSAEKLDEEFAKSLAALELQNLDHFSKSIKVARARLPVDMLNCNTSHCMIWARSRQHAPFYPINFSDLV